jgi:hypothetical protein
MSGFPAFVDYVDSYVLDIVESPGELVFVLEAALLTGHADYRPPRPGEAMCYKTSRLVFPAIRSIEWRARHHVVKRDPNGDTDMGELDETVADGDTYRLAGEWGEVLITSAPPRLEILGDATL